MPSVLGLVSVVHNSFNFVIGLVYGYRWLCCGSGSQLVVVLLLVWFIDTAGFVAGLVHSYCWFSFATSLCESNYIHRYSLCYLGIWTSFFFSDDLSV